MKTSLLSQEVLDLRADNSVQTISIADFSKLEWEERVGLSWRIDGEALVRYALPLNVEPRDRCGSPFEADATLLVVLRQSRTYDKYIDRYIDIGRFRCSYDSAISPEPSRWVTSMALQGQESLGNLLLPFIDSIIMATDERLPASQSSALFLVDQAVRTILPLILEGAGSALSQEAPKLLNSPTLGRQEDYDIVTELLEGIVVVADSVARDRIASYNANYLEDQEKSQESMSGYQSIQELVRAIWGALSSVNRLASTWDEEKWDTAYTLNRKMGSPLELSANTTHLIAQEVMRMLQLDGLLEDHVKQDLFSTLLAGAIARSVPDNATSRAIARLHPVVAKALDNKMET